MHIPVTITVCVTLCNFHCVSFYFPQIPHLAKLSAKLYTSVTGTLRNYVALMYIRVHTVTSVSQLNHVVCIYIGSHSNLLLEEHSSDEADPSLSLR